MEALKLLKKAAKWYFKQSSNGYAWLPSGMVPYLGQ